MQTDNNVPGKKSSKVSIVKIILWMLFFIFLFFLIPFFGVPAYLSSDSGKTLILSRVNSAIDGQVKVDSLSMGWFEGVKVQQFDFSDSTGCTKITAKELAARPKYLDLLAGRLTIDQAVIDQPRVVINISGDCAPKTETRKIIVESPNAVASSTFAETKISQASASSVADTPAALLAMANIDLTVKDGDFKFTAPDSNNDMQTLELRNINSKLAIRPLGSKTSFDVSMAVASGNEVSQINTVGSVKTGKNEWSFANTSGEISLEVNDLNIATLGPLFKVLKIDVSAVGRVSAVVDAKVQKGLFENLQAQVAASNVDISGDVLKGDRIQTPSLQADIKLNTTETAVNIDKLKIEADGLTADVKGTIPKTMRSLEDFLKADSPDSLQAQFDCDVAKTFKQVKTIAGFKHDFDISYGRLSGDINTQAQNGKRTLAGKVKLWALEGKFPVKKIVLSKPVELDAKITSQQDKIYVEKFNLDSAFAKANITGTTDNMTYQARFDLAQMQSDVGQFFEINPTLTGDANFAGKAAFAKSILSSTGSGALSKLYIKFQDGKELSESSASITYDFTSDFESGKLTVHSADIVASPGVVNVKDSIFSLKDDSAVQTQVNADIAIELANARQYLMVFTSLDPNALFAGSASGNVLLNAKDKIVDVIVKQITVKNFSLVYPGQETFSQEYLNIAFNGRFDTVNNTRTIENLSFTSPQIKLTGKFTDTEVGKNIKTEGSLVADYNLAAASSLISPFLPSGLAATGKRSDSIWFASTYPKETPALFKSNLNAKATFGFDNAKYMGLNIGKTDFNMKIDNGLMSITPFTSVVNQGKLNFAADANLRTTPSMLKVPGTMKVFDAIQIDSNTTDALLKYSNPLFADATDISGTLTLNTDKMNFPLQSGYKNDIAITGTLSVANMHIGGSSLLSQIIQLTGGSQNPTITVQPTKFILEKGILSYDDMPMTIDEKQVNFSGKIGLDRTMTMTVTLPWTRNSQRIKLPLKGTVDKPEIDVNQLLQDQLKQEFENQIKEGLQKMFK